MKQILIKKFATTGTRTYLGGEVADVPADVPEEMAKEWIKTGIAEVFEPPKEAPANKAAVPPEKK